MIYLAYWEIFSALSTLDYPMDDNWLSKISESHNFFYLTVGINVIALIFG